MVGRDVHLLAVVGSALPHAGAVKHLTEVARTHLKGAARSQRMQHVQRLSAHLRAQGSVKPQFAAQPAVGKGGVVQRADAVTRRWVVRPHVPAVHLRVAQRDGPAVPRLNVLHQRLRRHQKAVDDARHKGHDGGHDIGPAVHLTPGDGVGDEAAPAHVRLHDVGCVQLGNKRMRPGEARVAAHERPRDAAVGGIVRLAFVPAPLRLAFLKATHVHGHAPHEVRRQGSAAADAPRARQRHLVAAAPVQLAPPVKPLLHLTRHLLAGCKVDLVVTGRWIGLDSGHGMVGPIKNGADRIESLSAPCMTNRMVPAVCPYAPGVAAPFARLRSWRAENDLPGKCSVVNVQWGGAGRRHKPSQAPNYPSMEAPHMRRFLVRPPATLTYDTVTQNQKLVKFAQNQTIGYNVPAESRSPGASVSCGQSGQDSSIIRRKLAV